MNPPTVPPAAPTDVIDIIDGTTLGSLLKVDPISPASLGP
jgi:hypothetical protein